MTPNPFSSASAAATAITAQLGRPDVVVVCGSGWGDAATSLGATIAECRMQDLPGFPAPVVEGHSGVARLVDAGGKHLLVLAGRSHLYEGHGAHVAVHGVRAAVIAGARIVILTNAAGGLDPTHGIGEPILLSDHLNLTGANPMTGPEPPAEFGSRFCDLTDLYSPRLRAAARRDDETLRDGVYAGLLGGSYETPAEIRMLRTLGADLVGMSTVLEAIAARHLKAEVAGVSLVTNLAAGISQTPLNHEEVLEAGRAAVPRLVRLLSVLVAAA